MTVTLITDNTPRYFPNHDKGKALSHHYTNGGYLWKRRDDQPKGFKTWASGILPISRLAVYELFMVDGRKPTDENIQEAHKASYDSSNQLAASV